MFDTPEATTNIDDRDKTSAAAGVQVFHRRTLRRSGAAVRRQNDTGRSAVVSLDLAAPAKWTAGRPAIFVGPGGLDGEYLSNSVPRCAYSVARADGAGPTVERPAPRPADADLDEPAATPLPIADFAARPRLGGWGIEKNASRHFSLGSYGRRR
ncbi:Hypothetical protein CINCED_3A000771 [Cinara cedri]|uniref:Uncharacterized protein n=1 Tax=Cinara cedri TaxID=506608 RepID=A0A5E4MCL9_9HEMI|nr:Hypothetical protein CINCED_3A000771 [Cinara cedri]